MADSVSDSRSLRLTKTDIEALVPGQRDSFVPVEGFKGLYMRVLPNGVKSYVLRYRFDGIQRKHVLGVYPSMTPDSAKRAHAAVWSQIHAGEDPNLAKVEAKKAAKEAQKAAVTVADLAERFIHEHIGAKVTPKGEGYEFEIIRGRDGKPVGNKESTAREHTRMIYRNILPVLGTMPVKEVGTADIAAMLFKLRKDHPTLSNRVRAVLSKMFAKAELWEYRPAGSNPSRGQDRAPEHKKERNLSDKEIFALGAVLRATDEVNERARAVALKGKHFPKTKPGEIKPEEPFALVALRLAMLTGMRKSEIIGDAYRGIPALVWSDVDLESGVLLVHHKTETKTGKKRVVHLCSAALSLLKALPRHLGNPHVVPGDLAGRSLVNLQAVWDRIRDLVTLRARMEAEKARLKVPAVDISDVTIHDLRRTFSSVGARLGYPELWLGGLLGHSASTVTQGYARVDGDPLRVAVEAIGARIDGLLTGAIDPAVEAENQRKAKDANRAPGKEA